MSARILAVCNQKGGVGKSTTAFHFARAAVLEELRVLLVDLDPQGNITASATGDGEDGIAPDQAGIADVLSSRSDATLRDIIVPGIWPGLDVAPTTGTGLGVVRDELVVSGTGREVRLRNALETVRGEYDLILIDCAPSLDQLVVNGLAAADAAVIVTQTKRWSLDGLALLLQTIRDVKAYYNAGLAIAGILVNFHEERTISGQAWADDLQEAARSQGLQILDPPVPKKVVIADAVEASTGLDEWGTREAKALARMYGQHLATIRGVLA